MASFLNLKPETANVTKRQAGYGNAALGQVFGLILALLVLFGAVMLIRGHNPARHFMPAETASPTATAP